MALFKVLRIQVMLVKLLVFKVFFLNYVNFFLDKTIDLVSGTHCIKFLFSTYST